MADLSDVTAYLKGQALAAVYPNGTGSASVAAMDVRIGEGWPNAEQLDLLVGGFEMNTATPPVKVARPNGPGAMVTVFPLQGTGRTTYQILDETYVVAQPTYGMSFSVTNGVITVTGQPNVGEYLTVIADKANVYSLTGANTAAILAGLASAAQAQYPSASATATTLTIPVQFSLVVRQGGIGTLGKVTWRQEHDIAVTVWAPTPASRTTLAAAVDNLIKQNIRITLPDTSQALIRYSRTNVTDEQEAETVYRRDLIYCAEYATIETFQGYVVTSTDIPITIPGPDQNYTITAVQ